MATTSEELQRLVELRDQGVLTPEEFEAEKAKVLAGQSTGTVVSPPLKAPAPPKKRSAVLGCVVLLIGVVVIIVALAAIFGGGGSKPDASTTKPALKVTANELFLAYKDNEAAAQQMYGDRPLEVSGVIDSINLDILDNPVVVLKTDNEFQSAQATLTADSKSKAAGLHKGDSVSLTCAGVNEVIGSPMLKDCDLP